MRLIETLKRRGRHLLRLFSAPEEPEGDPPVFLLVGLGNPGGKHALNRHNVGFMVVDAIAESFNFSSERKRFQGLAREGTIAGKKVLVLKPQTFMNESGRSVAEAARFYKIAPENVVIAYDELDLAPFKIKLKTGGGLAGHNGLKSIKAHLSTDAFRRLRFGIGHPGAKPLVSNHVLSNFSKAEMETLPDYLGAIAAEAESLVTGDDPKFLSDIALRLR